MWKRQKKKQITYWIIEKKISAGYTQITKDLEEQNKKFLERRKTKKKINMEKKPMKHKATMMKIMKKMGKKKFILLFRIN